MNGLSNSPKDVCRLAPVFVALCIAVAAGRSGSLWAQTARSPRAESAVGEDRQLLQFNRDIRPVLSAACFRCHGADPHSREAELRLDVRDEAVADRGDYRAIWPGSPGRSELISRVTAAGDSERMPPPDEHRQLSQREIDRLRLWIEQGAEYEQHWAFISPTRPPLPKCNSQPMWPRNGIDRFVLARLEREGLQPSPEADRAALLRRVTLDLTGLPPSLEEINRYLADESADAYERVVDRLLQSNRYGEQMGRHWLDAARYADTSGFFTDDERFMWRWRDWVIDAFNDNMPFDQFTVEQLAGDLLANPTTSQRIATGFNRNHMTTHETGVIDEEYRVEYVIDRLETTSTTWLALTLGCARCHDHKYDPISQKEFYQFFAFFNNGPETGNTGRAGNALPVLETPTAEFQQRLQRLREQVAEARRKLKRIEPELAAAQSQWEEGLLDRLPPPPADGLVAHLDMDAERRRQRAVETEPQGKAAPRSHGNPPIVARGVEFTEGLFGSAASFDGDAVIEVAGKGDFDRRQAFSWAAWINSETSGPACVLSKNDDADSLRGCDLMLRKGKAVVHLIHRWNSDAIQVISSAPIRTGRWQHISVTYDGSGTAAGIAIYFDGERQAVEIRHDSLRGTIRTDQPLRIGRRSTSAAFRGKIDDVRVYNRQLPAKEVESLAASELVRSIVQTPVDERTPFQRDMLRRRYLSEAAPLRLRRVVASESERQGALQRLLAVAPTTMVMQDRSKPRETFLLKRGQYDQPGEQVAAGVPASLPALPPAAPPNRLALARWLVSGTHPLTSRVAANRSWRRHFGTGIVKTVEDFGTQGEWPSHPDLLDWLAVEFAESGWDVKHLERLIVTSSTYRQSSQPTEPLPTRHAAHERRARDPDNRLLARGPRFRLDAEVIRDNALAISGLLVERTGGPSVKPYQPPGLWEAVSYDGGSTYAHDQGEALFRRSLYTFWKRQSPPPGMLAFDAPTRETCTVRRPRTNTPLQALALMNDTTYVEAARALAQRMMTDSSCGTEAERLRFGLRLATARHVEADEADVLLDVYRQQLAVYRRDREAAKRLLSVGESPRRMELDAAQHAAWTIVASIILNLDETVTRQ